MKADSFPVVRKGWGNHTAKWIRCQGRNIPSSIPKATVPMLAVYEKKDYRKCSDLCFTPVTASPSSTVRCTGPGRQLLVPQNDSFYVLIKKFLPIGLMEWGSSGYLAPVIVCHNHGWQYRAGLNLDPRYQLYNQRSMSTSICWGTEQRRIHSEVVWHC